MSNKLVELTGRDKHHLVQLCLPIEKAKGKLKFPVLASEKLDGVFGLILVKDDECHIYSRTGEEYLSLNHLKDEAMALVDNTHYQVLIAELYTPGLPQPIISGYCRDTKAQHPEIKAYVHDWLPLSDFISGVSTEEFAYRQMDLKGRWAFCETMIDFRYLERVAQLPICNKQDLMAYAQVVWDQGGEGVVAVSITAPYQPGKRNASMVKVKEGVTFDLRVVNINEGAGKFAGMVGNLVCIDAKDRYVNVGSGLSTEERKAWWKKPQAIIGKIVEVAAMSVSTKGVLREPRYKGIRHDKTQEDTIG